MRFQQSFLKVFSFVLLASVAIFAQGKAASPTSGLTSLLPMMLVLFAIIYFLMIRPEQKKQKERQALLSAVKKGDKVLTIGGIYGVVGSIKDSTVMIKIAENTTIEITKAAISSVINADSALEKPAEKEEKKK